MAIKSNPKRRFELVLEEVAAFAAAENEQWQIYAQRELWHLKDNPLYHGHVDGRVIMIRASQGHSGARVNISPFTRELTIEDDLPDACVHGTQGPLDSIIQHGLIPGGLTANGATPVRARHMVHFAVSLPSRLRGMPGSTPQTPQIHDLLQPEGLVGR